MSRVVDVWSSRKKKKLVDPGVYMVDPGVYIDRAAEDVVLSHSIFSGRVEMSRVVNWLTLASI